MFGEKETVDPSNRFNWLALSVDHFGQNQALDASLTPFDTNLNKGNGATLLTIQALSY